ncbi:MAG: hypothetical protein ACTXOO_02370 [Sodalis sp. (in: enterobacteria)]
MLLDELINKHAFLAHVKEVLVPKLVAGSLMIIDNSTIRKVDGVRKAIERYNFFLIHQILILSK